MFACHFVADFLLQSREMGKTKSTKFNVLLQHIGIQWLVMVFSLSFCVKINLACELGTLNAVVHGIIDWNIWRLYKWSAYYRIKKGIDKHLQLSYEGPIKQEQQWIYYEDHWFYATIGLDQLLHSLTLIVLAGVIL